MTIFDKLPWTKAKPCPFWVRIFDKAGHITQECSLSLDAAMAYAHTTMAQTDIIKIEIIDNQNKRSVAVIQKDAVGHIIK